MVRIRWTFDDAVSSSPFMERWLADIWLSEVRNGLRIDPASGVPDERQGIAPKRARLVTE